MLCEDDPQAIEDYPEDSRGSCCIIRGETDINGRVGHLLCSNPPNSLVITAYFPGKLNRENGKITTGRVAEEENSHELLLLQGR